MPAPAFLNQIAMVYCYALEYLKRLFHKGLKVQKRRWRYLYTYIIQIRFLLCDGSDCVIFGLFSNDVGRE